MLWPFFDLISSQPWWAARQKEFEQELARAVEEFDRQSKAFVQSLEDKALKNKLEKERQARKAELNRAVVSKIQTPKARGESAAQAETRRLGSVSDNGEMTVGSKVVTSFGNVGTVEKMDKEVAEVLVGGMRLREKIVNLRLAEQAETRAVASVPGKNRGIARPVDAPDASAELNLIGKTTAEADYELDRFIDEAYIASLPRVRIIHGFGTGALKNFVHHFLKNHDLVERYEFATPDHGGQGATVAELKL